MHRYSQFADPLSAASIQCTLCPKVCHIGLGQTGACGTRRNHEGQLEVLTHGRLHAVAVDPIEKKPLHHFLPGTVTFSVGTDGCNMVCPFCQNASLSQCQLNREYAPETVRQWSPEEVVTSAMHNGCDSIAFTYSEPSLAVEFAMEVAQIAAEQQLEVVYVTNGQINQEPLQQLCRHVSAANVDLKSFSASVYRDSLKGNLRTTLDTIEQMHTAGVWVEVTTLIVPGMNDAMTELSEMAAFIAGISTDIPWHLSRFHPAFQQMNLPATSPERIEIAMEIGAQAGLRFVYAGNLRNGKGENTCCPNCKDVVVDRTGFRVNRIFTQQGKCPGCGWHMAGIGFP